MARGGRTQKTGTLPQKRRFHGKQHRLVASQSCNTGRSEAREHAEPERAPSLSCPFVPSGLSRAAFGDVRNTRSAPGRARAAFGPPFSLRQLPPCFRTTVPDELRRIGTQTHCRTRPAIATVRFGSGANRIAKPFSSPARTPRPRTSSSGSAVTPQYLGCRGLCSCAGKRVWKPRTSASRA